MAKDERVDNIMMTSEVDSVGVCVLDFQCLGDWLLYMFPSSYQRKFFAGAFFTMFTSFLYYLLVRYCRLPIVLRQIYLIVTGICVLYGLLHFYAVHYFIMCALVYVQIQTISPNRLPFVYIVSTYGYLSYRLLQYMFVDLAQTQFHDSGLLMIFMARCTYIAFGIYDHSRYKKDEDLKLTTMQEENMIEKRMGLLDFASYVLFSPFLFFGPCTPYNTVTAYIKVSDDEISKRPSFLPFLFERFTLIVLFSAFFLVFADYAEYDWLLTSDYPIVKKWAWSVFIGELIKMKYYVAILFGECCATASGVGFSGYSSTGKPLYSNVLNLRAFDCIFPCSPKLLMEGWHITISQWLRYSVYERVTIMKTLSVFIASALWHGFYIGILLGMTYGAVLVLAGRNMRRLLRHRVNLTSNYCVIGYDLITTMFSVLFSTPFMIIYVANDANKVLPLIKSHLWLPTLICFIIAILPIKRTAKTI